MDEAGCDPALLANTYRDFDRVNALVSGWRGIYTRYLRPVLREAGAEATVLDIGCGAGDVCRRLAAWAKADGFSPCFVGADPDERAIEYAKGQANPPGTRFYCGTAEQLADKGETFTIVLSNHVLHHLTDSEVTWLCETSTRFAPRLVLHADIHRHPVAYATFPVIGGLFPGTYILPDGLLSIRRSFTPDELRRIAPRNDNRWRVETAFPFRLRLVWTP
ncbi:MAG: methyltransferase domain-containing protein [Armatimonadetes bacterium]|nr:methyltransferase domain-containing protein [Armatimonadota bacterium]